MASDTIKIRVRGSDIVQAVKNIASEFIETYDYIDGKDLFVVGQRSNYPYDHIEVTADGNGIDPSCTYSSVKVAEGRWGGEIYCIGYSDDAPIMAVKEFTAKLRLELAKFEIQEEPPIRFQFAGISYECPYDACTSGFIVLPDGRVLKVGVWFESYPPQPGGLVLMCSATPAKEVK